MWDSAQRIVFDRRAQTVIKRRFVCLGQAAVIAGSSCSSRHEEAPPQFRRGRAPGGPIEPPQRRLPAREVCQRCFAASLLACLPDAALLLQPDAEPITDPRRAG